MFIETSGYSPDLSDWEGETVDETNDHEQLIEKRGTILEFEL